VIGVSGRPPAVAASRSNRRKWIAGIAGVLGVILVAWLVEFSSVLGVSTVTVTGTHFLTADEVEQAAAIPHGEPLARLDTGAVAARVRTLAPVRTVKVQTAYPSTVRIIVTERTAVGYRAGETGTSLVDATDVTFRRVAAEPKGLPQLMSSGSSAADDAIAAVAGSLGPVLASKVARITAQTPQSVTLTLTDARTVLWGGTDRGADKAQLVLALLARPGQYFDVSAPDQVITRGS
jgi:cell division protein FtsQ